MSTPSPKSSDSAAIAARLSTHHIRLLRVLSDLAAKQTPMMIPLRDPQNRRIPEGPATAQLVAAGLVERAVVGPNRRYRITTKGQDVYGQVVARVVAMAGVRR